MIEQKGLTGVTDKTPEKLQLDAGIFLKKFNVEENSYVDSDILFATRGGGSFSAAPNGHQASADGAPSNYKGLDRIDEWVVTLSATALDFTKDVIKLALGANVKEEEGTHYTKLTVGNTITDTDYQDLWWVGALSNGKYVAICVKNAMNKAGASWTFADKSETTTALTFTANYDYATLKSGVAPFEIYYPKEEE